MIVHRKNPTHVLAGIGVALIAVLACVLVAGCSRNSSESDEVVEIGPTPEELAAARKEDLNRRIKGNISKTQMIVRRNADDFLGAIDRFRGVLQDARGTKYEKVVQDIIDDLEKRHIKKAQSELDAAIARADKHNNASSPDHRAAICARKAAVGASAIATRSNESDILRAYSW